MIKHCFSYFSTKKGSVMKDNQMGPDDLQGFCFSSRLLFALSRALFEPGHCLWCRPVFAFVFPTPDASVSFCFAFFTAFLKSIYVSPRQYTQTRPNLFHANLRPAQELSPRE